VPEVVAVSLKTIIKAAHQRVDIRYESSQVVTGGQLQTVWKNRHANVAVRLNANIAQAESSKFDRQTVVAEYTMYLEFLPGIVQTDKVVWGTRTFEIRKIDNYDELGQYLRLSLEETK
jgi:hypothetical protein